MLKEKEDLIEEIKGNLHLITNKKSIEKMKEEMKGYGISEGQVERIIIHPDKLMDSDMREVALFTEAIYKHSGAEGKSLDPTEWFTEAEMKEAYQYNGLSIQDRENFPVTLDNVSIVGNGVYSTAVSVKQIASWLESDSLYYNFDIQRQPDLKMRRNEVIRSPKIHKKNVEEMKKLLLSGELIVTTLAFNAAPQTSDGDEELTYSARDNTLTINRGTRLDILDGFHRCLASKSALMENPELDFNFNVLISNYTTRQAQQYQAQLAKATPIEKARIKQLESNRYADTVVKQLVADSELKGKVSSSNMVNRRAGQLVSYSVLSDAIDREFDIKARVQTVEISKYLSEFFDHLIGYNIDKFDFNNKNSIMWHNKMFIGYIALAGRMYKEGIPAHHVTAILNQVNFSKDNYIWKDLGYLDENGNVSKKNVDKKIADYFRGLKITVRQI